MKSTLKGHRFATRWIFKRNTHLFIRSTNAFWVPNSIPCTVPRTCYILFWYYYYIWCYSFLSSLNIPQYNISIYKFFKFVREYSKINSISNALWFFFNFQNDSNILRVLSLPSNYWGHNPYWPVKTDWVWHTGLMISATFVTFWVHTPAAQSISCPWDWSFLIPQKMPAWSQPPKC